MGETSGSNPFSRPVWPPNRGLFSGVPEEYIPEAGFSDMDGMTTCVTGVPERLVNDSSEIATELAAFNGLIYYKDGSDNTYLITHRSKAGSVGIYYNDGSWNKIRGATLQNTPRQLFAEMNDRLFVAGITDTDGALGSNLQMWDGTNWRIAKISTPGSISLTATTGGNMTPDKYYRYKYTFVDGDNFESPVGGNQTKKLTSSQNQMNLSNIDTGPAAEGIAKRRIYRTLGQDTSVAALNAPTYFLTTINDNTTTVYSDTNHDDTLDLNLGIPQYAAGWPSSVDPKGVAAWGGILYAWTDDKVYHSGRPPILTAADEFNQASAANGLYEPFYWQEDLGRNPGFDGDQIIACVGWRGILYCIKRNSIWAFDQRSIAPEAWKFDKVSDVGAAAPESIGVAEDGIYFMRAVSGANATLWRFDGVRSTMLSGNVLFDSLATISPWGTVYEYEGVVWVNGQGNSVWGYNPQTRQWSRHDDHNHLFSVELAWGGVPVVYYVTYNVADSYEVRSRGRHIRRSSVAQLGDAYCTTGRHIAQLPDMPKSFKKLRFQVSTSGDTTVTVTGYTDVLPSGAQIWTGTINSATGVITDILIPESLVRGRWLKLKFAFTGNEWARLDGYTIYGHYDPPRNN